MFTHCIFCTSPSSVKAYNLQPAIVITRIHKCENNIGLFGKMDVQGGANTC